MFLKWVGLMLMQEGSGLLNINQFSICLEKVPLKRFVKTLLLSRDFKFIFCVSLIKIWKNSEN
jgi:hypothetical protein